LATALKTILFMPMAVSFLSAGVTWRLVYDDSPDRGVLNAVVVAAHDVFEPASPYPGARPRDDSVLAGAQGGAYRTVNQVRPGDPVLLPLVGLTPDKVPAAATQAATPTGDGVWGVVWLDFSPGGGGKAGAVDPWEKGLPGIHVQAARDGTVLATATTDNAGRFSFPTLTGNGYTLTLPASNFAAPFNGVSWLGPSLITPAIIVSYLCIWAGFAMVLISAGLAALPREALEAARVDGATEWQVFRLVTIPLVRPVLVVVLVTLVINVLKIFDLVYVIAPDSSQSSATVVAVEMYKVSFGGGLNDGLGSALGVLLFILVVPAMLFNIRRLRRDPS
jgi:alpha-glucoside transport system permease protein